MMMKWDFLWAATYHTSSTSGFPFSISDHVFQGFLAIFFNDIVDGSTSNSFADYKNNNFDTWIMARFKIGFDSRTCFVKSYVPNSNFFQLFSSFRVNVVSNSWWKFYSIDLNKSKSKYVPKFNVELKLNSRIIQAWLKKALDYKIY